MKPRRGIYIDSLPLLTRNDDICNLEEAFLDHLELTNVSDSFPSFFILNLPRVRFTGY